MFKKPAVVYCCLGVIIAACRRRYCVQHCYCYRQLFLVTILSSRYCYAALHIIIVVPLSTVFRIVYIMSSYFYTLSSSPYLLLLCRSSPCLLLLSRVQDCYTIIMSSCFFMCHCHRVVIVACAHRCSPPCIIVIIVSNYFFVLPSLLCQDSLC